MTVSPCYRQVMRKQNWCSQLVRVCLANCIVLAVIPHNFTCNLWLSFCGVPVHQCSQVHKCSGFRTLCSINGVCSQFLCLASVTPFNMQVAAYSQEMWLRSTCVHDVSKGRSRLACGLAYWLAKADTQSPLLLLVLSFHVVGVSAVQRSHAKPVTTSRARLARAKPTGQME